MGEILFWMAAAPNSSLDSAAWTAFRHDLGWSFAGVTALFIILATLVYSISAHAVRIRRADDLFRPFHPLACLFLAAGPAVILFFDYRYRFHASFPESIVSPDAGAMTTALAAGAIAFISMYLLMCIPGLTPARLGPRPVGWLFDRYGTRPSEKKAGT